MKCKMHFRSRMFLTDPYVVRIKHPGSTHDNIKLAEFLKYRKVAKQQVTSTWGYSDPVFEIIKSDNEETHAFFGSSITFKAPLEECHSYWVFTDEADALQFRLTAGESIHMHMWPKRILFTIYEYGPD